MEGVLWKWTNYWNGWQTRWFVLEDGCLTYYKSQEAVNQGCKGSIKVLACEINVNAVDSTRLDLVIPGEQRMYLRAATSHDRQQWLVALGSAKACVNHHSILATLPRANNIPAGIHTENKTDTLKSKRSELRLYCDLLMQQVHLVKTSASPDASDGDKNGPDVAQLDEATSLLTATCDTFIRTLEDIMRLAQPDAQVNRKQSQGANQTQVLRSNSQDR